MRSLRRAARNVAVFHLPCGTLSTRRSPFGAQPRSRVMLVLVHVSSMKIRRLGSMRPDSLASARGAGLCRHDPARARRGSFFKRHANLAKEAAHHRGVGFDPSLGRKAIAKSLKRDVGLLGPRGLQKITVLDARWPPCPTGSREPSRSTRSSPLIATDSLIA